MIPYFLRASVHSVSSYNLNYNLINENEVLNQSSTYHAFTCFVLEGKLKFKQCYPPMLSRGNEFGSQK